MFVFAIGRFATDDWSTVESFSRTVVRADLFDQMSLLSKYVSTLNVNSVP
jgi:hypothetical protein